MNILQLVIQSALAKHDCDRVEVTVHFIDTNYVYRCERVDFIKSDFRRYVIEELEKEFIMLKRSDIEMISKIGTELSKKK